MFKWTVCFWTEWTTILIKEVYMEIRTGFDRIQRSWLALYCTDYSIHLIYASIELKIGNAPERKSL